MRSGRRGEREEKRREEERREEKRRERKRKEKLILQESQNPSKKKKNALPNPVLQGIRGRGLESRHRPENGRRVQPGRPAGRRRPRRRGDPVAGRRKRRVRRRERVSRGEEGKGGRCQGGGGARARGLGGRGGGAVRWVLLFLCFFLLCVFFFFFFRQRRRERKHFRDLQAAPGVDKGFVRGHIDAGRRRGAGGLCARVRRGAGCPQGEGEEVDGGVEEGF